MTQELATPDFPPAAQSLMAARKIVGRRASGVVRVIRRYVTVGIASWKAEAKLVTGEGIDYEIEVEGESLEEVSYTLLDALQKVQVSVEEEE